ncbi:MAG: glycosyltransferase [Candidatus Marinimicrobia bacterium]|nr:glycosyltransferase [Candidatus Neomarinimicrobiota bacterium]
MVSKQLPSISILIPTLNAARVLGGCLKSINQQDYPKEKIEIIIADGGSTDQTLAMAKKSGAKIEQNPLQTGEAGKAVALKKAKNELVALIDSDNFLPDKNWLRKMVAPLADPAILGTEPWEFTYRKKDSLVNRYCALLGANDPYCYFVGNYDKKSVLSGKWTGLKIKQEDKGDYLKVKISRGILPTIGANGTIWRTVVLKETVDKSDYLFDTDIPYLLAKKKSFQFAKVKIGIVHLYCQTIKDFYRKQKRRVRDFYILEGQKERKETYQRQTLKQLSFVFSVVLILPLFYQTLKGYWKKPDRAWAFHPLACIITLWLYGSETILTKFKKTPINRENWKQ